MTEKPSWDDAPPWATHLLVSSRDGLEYGWSERVDWQYFSDPVPPVETWERVRFVMDYWNVAEARPEAPASAEPARCGQCHFAGPVEMRMCLCRRHAPAGTRNPPHVLDIRSGCLTSSAPAFPIMAAERDWCGDFQPAAATEGANA